MKSDGFSRRVTLMCRAVDGEPRLRDGRRQAVRWAPEAVEHAAEHAARHAEGGHLAGQRHLDARRREAARLLEHLDRHPSPGELDDLPAPLLAGRARMRTSSRRAAPAGRPPGRGAARRCPSAPRTRRVTRSIAHSASSRARVPAISARSASLPCAIASAGHLAEAEEPAGEPGVEDGAERHAARRRRSPARPWKSRMQPQHLERLRAAGRSRRPGRRRSGGGSPRAAAAPSRARAARRPAATRSRPAPPPPTSSRSRCRSLIASSRSAPNPSAASRSNQPREPLRLEREGDAPVDRRVVAAVGEIGGERPQRAGGAERALRHRLGEVAAGRRDRADDRDRPLPAAERLDAARRARRTARAARRGRSGSPPRPASPPGAPRSRAAPRPSARSSRS